MPSIWAKKGGGGPGGGKGEMASTLLILICSDSYILCLIYQHAPTLGLRLAQRRMVAHPVVKNLPSDAGDTGSSPSSEKIPHAVQQ